MGEVIEVSCLNLHMLICDTCCIVTVLHMNDISYLQIEDESSESVSDDEESSDFLSDIEMDDKQKDTTEKLAGRV